MRPLPRCRHTDIDFFPARMGLKRDILQEIECVGNRLRFEEHQRYGKNKVGADDRERGEQPSPDMFPYLVPYSFSP